MIEEHKTVWKILRQSRLLDADLPLFLDEDLDVLGGNEFVTTNAFK